MCGKVRTETIKRLARDIYDRFSTQFNTDFNNNKQILEKISKTSSKHFRNRIAGYITRIVAIEQKKEQLESSKSYNI
ncbi:MAG: 30S ribosomal protein S17e [Promethearchaeota archaeon]|nr:MAG: 30S ribosomal protein S17e [Candidatus Lokiarchaeota archaeon]